MILEQLLTLEDHPTRATATINGDAVEVPAFPEMRQIMHEGRRIGYCSIVPGAPISLIRRVTDYEKGVIHEWVAKQVGEPGQLFQPPVPQVVDEETDETDYEDEV